MKGNPVLRSTLPVCSIESVYLVIVRPKVVHPPKKQGGPPAVKKPKLARVREEVPNVPTDAAARDHYACAQVDVAFRAFVAHTGVEVVWNVHITCQSLMIPQSTRETMRPFDLWQHLASNFLTQEIIYIPHEPDTFHVPAYLTTFYVVGGETRHGLPGLEDTFLVRVMDRKVDIFSPQKDDFQPFNYSRFVHNKLSWVKEIVYEAP